MIVKHLFSNFNFENALSNKSKHFPPTSAPTDIKEKYAPSLLESHWASILNLDISNIFGITMLSTPNCLLIFVFKLFETVIRASNLGYTFSA